MNDIWEDPFAASGANSYTDRFTVDGPSSSRQTIDIDDQGDLWLDVGGVLSDANYEKAGGGNGDDDREGSGGSAVGAMIDLSRWCGNGQQERAKRHRGVYRFRVCSRTMRRTSRVWKAMLFGPWLERKPANDEGWVVAFPDDQPMAIAVLLAIVHGRMDLVPRWSNAHVHYASYKAISGVLSVADKYDVIRLCWPLVHDWHLGAQDVMVTTIERFIFELPGNRLEALLAAAEDGPRIGMSLSLRDVFRTIAGFRQDVIQSTLDFFHGFMDDLNSDNGMMDDPGKDTSMLCMGDIFGAVRMDAVERGMIPYFKNSLIILELRKRHGVERSRCNAFVLGELVSRLPEEGFPRTAKDVDISADDLLDKVKDAIDASHEGRNLQRVPLPGHERCHPNANDTLYRFRRRLKDRFNPWNFVELLDAKQVDWLKKRADILGTRRVQLDSDFWI